MLIPADVVAQRRYAKSAHQSHTSGSLGIGPAILRGLRDLGYRDSAAAVCALVDNAIDALAGRVEVVLDVSAGQVRSLAVIDDGIGMVPEMIRAACAVGANCKLGEGPHLGRVGFGLPSAPFAIGRRFEIFSQPSGCALAKAEVDLASLDTDEAEIPGETSAKLPDFVARHLTRSGLEWGHGTVVVVSDLDRLSPGAPVALREALHRRLGYVFQAFSQRVSLSVDGTAVRPADPLFLTAGALGFDIDLDRAIAGPERTIRVGEGTIQVRTAVLPPGFCALDKRREATGRNVNLRQAIARDTHGLVVSRLGRRVDLLADTPLINFGQGDRALKVELNFSSELDEMFAPDLSLQNVHITGPAWKILREAGIGRDLEMLRRQIKEQRFLRRETLTSKVSARRHPGGAIAAEKEISHG